MSNPRVLVPLPDRDFDVTEVAVPWHIMTRSGIDVVFATEQGATPACDPLLLTGVVFGQLGAEPEPKRLYHQMEDTDGFKKPISYAGLDPSTFDGLLLPGGHAKGMRQYLESTPLFDVVRETWKLRRPVAAICHGVLVLARTVDPQTGRSVLFDRRTTCLPKYMERTAYYTTSWKVGDYYRTYPTYVEDEVKRALAHPEQFLRGPLHLFARGTDTDDGPAFVVEDGPYVSARWPGDAYRLGKSLTEKVLARAKKQVARDRADGAGSGAR